MNAPSFDEASSLHRNYRVLFELGRGGMARVYLAESLSSGIRKLVVLKVLNAELCASPEMRALFRREAELSAQMNHPNVVQVLEVVESAHTPVIVMEYLDGISLSLLLKNAGQALPLPLRLAILTQVLAGLHHFHELRDLDGASLNAVHRDVSPQNVLVLHDGLVKVLDFGIAKVSAVDGQATRSGLIKGKLHYMPPEQLLTGAEVDRRADIFAVGVMLWEALAGRRMWEGRTEAEVVRALAIGELPALREAAPAQPEALLGIVERATSIESKGRFATAQAMQAALEAAMAEQGWFAQPHELAAFMLRHFGDARRARELKIQSSRRAPLSPEELLDCRPSTPPASEPGASSTFRERAPGSLNVLVSRVWPLNRRRWRGAAAALGFAALVGGVAGWQRWTAVAEPTETVHAAAPAPTMVALEVDVLPPEAEIILNGKLVARAHAAVSVPVSEQKLVLELRAPGYRSQRRELSLRKDLAIEIALESERAVETASQVVPSATASSAAARSRGQRQIVSGSSRGVRSTSSRCDPPYVFDADGVKTYKSECF